MENSTLSTSAEVIASLEGMKVVLKPQHCELHEYNFEENCWHEVDRSARPIKTREAEMWVAGWNNLDRQAALRLLSDEFVK